MTGDFPGVHRRLSAHVVGMLAIGGTVGTGLFYSVSQTLANGPFWAILAYCYVGLVCLVVVQVIAEMACVFPVAGLLCQFPIRFLLRPMGQACNLVYWFSWLVTLALELVLLGEFLRPYLAEKYVILASWALLTAVNLLPVSFYGYTEYAVSLVKVVALVLWMAFVGFMVVFGGLPDVGIDLWVQNYPYSFFGEGVLVSGPILSRFLALLTSLVAASFTFQLAESIAITAGEVREPTVAIPRAARLVFVRIFAFYVLSVVLLSLSVPYNYDFGGRGDQTDPFSSPFLVVLVRCGLLPNLAMVGVFNVVVFCAVVSAANSNIYFGLRCMVAMSETGILEPYWGKTSVSGVPVRAVFATAIPGLLALLTQYKLFQYTFNLLLNSAALAGLLMWLLCLWSYWRFHRALVLGGSSREELPYKSSLNLPIWSLIAAANVAAVIGLNGVSNLWKFSWDSMVACYLTPFIFTVLWGAFWVQNGGPVLVPIEEIGVRKMAGYGSTDVGEEEGERETEGGYLDAW